MIAIPITSPKTSYYPLEIPDDLPKPKTNRILRYLPQSQDTKQAIKKRFRIFHKISFESQKPSKPLPSSDIRRLTKLLKQLKYLPYLGIALNSLPQKDKVLLRFFESVKHTQAFSQIHFYFMMKHWSIHCKDEVLTSCQIVRYICALPRKNIKLTFPFYYFSGDKREHKLLKSFTRQKCFTSVHLNCEFGSKICDIEEIITILSNTKSLSEFSLTLKTSYLTYENPPLAPRAIFYSLKEIKTLKNCRVYFKNCYFDVSELKRLVPALKEAAQAFNIEIILERLPDVAYFSIFEWWLFRRSLRNLSPVHTVNAKFIGKLQPFSIEDWIRIFYIFFSCGVIFLVMLIYSDFQK